MNEPASATTSSLSLWIVRGLSLVALAISIYLAWLALTGQTAAGCGGDQHGGCDFVLASRWSKWLEQPIGLMAASLWLTALLTSLFAGKYLPQKLAQAAWFVLLVLSTSAALCAIWFIGLQWLLLRHWCWYCLGVHVCGLLACAVVMPHWRERPTAQGAGVALGIALGLIVPVGQWLVPPRVAYDLHFVKHKPLQVKVPLKPFASTGTTPSTMEILGGEVEIDVSPVPHVGAADAPYVTVLLYDYTCEYCRKLHEQLRAAQTQFNGKLTIVMLPLSLSPDCQPEDKDIPAGCELGRLSLIVWKLAPDKFAEYDAWLFAEEKPRTIAAAREQAAKLVGEAKLVEAEKDDRYAQQLAQHAQLRKLSPAKLVPQLHAFDTIVSGQVSSVSELVEALESDFGMKR